MNGPEHYAAAERLLGIVMEDPTVAAQADPINLAAAQVHATLARAPGEPSLSLIHELVEQMYNRGGCLFRTHDGMAQEVRTVAYHDPAHDLHRHAVTLDDLRLILDAAGPL